MISFFDQDFSYGLLFDSLNSAPDLVLYGDKKPDMYQKHQKMPKMTALQHKDEEITL